MRMHDHEGAAAAAACSYTSSIGYHFLALQKARHSPTGAVLRIDPQTRSSPDQGVSRIRSAPAEMEYRRGHAGASVARAAKSSRFSYVEALQKAYRPSPASLLYLIPIVTAAPDHTRCNCHAPRTQLPCHSLPSTCLLIVAVYNPSAILVPPTQVASVVSNHLIQQYALPQNQETV
ncbi:hypothetical protein BC834DRAFT_148224 [Gloeopeniophorella convolvens]|nr:hypothetical protein BC834DRAFT_148224 [Gloeopeniophorella convolvens]